MKLGTISVGEVSDLHSKVEGHNNKLTIAVGLFVMYGSWQETLKRRSIVLRDDVLESMIQRSTVSLRTALDDTIVLFSGAFQIDESEESLQQCLGDNDGDARTGHTFPCPPEELPVLLVAVQSISDSNAYVNFVSEVSPSELLRSEGIGSFWVESIRRHILSIMSLKPSTRQVHKSHDETAIRLFIAGDRSQVGKTSMCLGLLGCLISMGYEPASLAYIKPATQSESPQLVQAYCEKVGISCVPIGPIVYYRGFTRAFLAGETESSEELLHRAANAVNSLAMGKRVVVIDGVGFPSVGSICGTDNAAVATSCGYPGEDGSVTPPGVVIIGPPGVGAAVDSFNLNATYFEAHKVPVLGGIFNKLSLEGFYSLESCREQVNSYFAQRSTSTCAFGFVPLAPQIVGASPLDSVDSFIRLFGDHVDVHGILKAAARLPRATDSATKRPAGDIEDNQQRVSVAKKTKYWNGGTGRVVSREDIEARAMASGAAPSA